ncbi:MAG TPA: copper resistance CopC family protein [Actinophytocola sp.]|nr:copper resistance CopC family protein [Actinophytocola sp.]
MLVRRLAAAVLLSGLTLTLTATPALAHAELIASTPAENATIAAAPRNVQLTFNEPVALGANPIEIVGPGNVTWQVGKPALAGPVITAPVVATGPAGKYTLVYRVVSGDGDAVSGSVPFTMSTAVAPPTPTTSAAPTTSAPAGSAEATVSATRSEPATDASAPAADDDGTPLWVWLLGGALLLAAIAVVTLRVRRSSR